MQTSFWMKLCRVTPHESYLTTSLHTSLNLKFQCVSGLQMYKCYLGVSEYAAGSIGSNSVRLRLVFASENWQQQLFDYCTYDVNYWHTGRWDRVGRSSGRGFFWAGAGMEWNVNHVESVTLISAITVTFLNVLRSNLLLKKLYFRAKGCTFLIELSFFSHFLSFLWSLKQQDN